MVGGLLGMLVLWIRATLVQQEHDVSVKVWTLRVCIASVP